MTVLSHTPAIDLAALRIQPDSEALLTERINTATPIRSPSPNTWGSSLTMTLSNAAAISGLSITTLRRHAANGNLRLIKLGGRTLVESASLRRLLQQ